MISIQNCELCSTDGGTVVFRNELLRVILVNDPDYPGFCRVIWTEHVKEMSDLTAAHRELIMKAVFAVESAVRKVMQPDKINLASLGNMVPHLHWHVIPRYRDDRHFPAPIWATAQRTSPDHSTRLSPVWRDQLAALISHALSQ